MFELYRKHQFSIGGIWVVLYHLLLFFKFWPYISIFSDIAIILHNLTINLYYRESARHPHTWDVPRCGVGDQRATRRPRQVGCVGEGPRASLLEFHCVLSEAYEGWSSSLYFFTDSTSTSSMNQVLTHSLMGGQREFSNRDPVGIEPTTFRTEAL